jgi:hypothetical protein
MIGTSLIGIAEPAVAATGTSAWNGDSMEFDTSSVVSRSDIVLQQANNDRYESLPLGNGRLGVAAWSPTEGPTFQVNRSNLLGQSAIPSLGELVIPSLGRVTTSADFAGRLDLYDGVLRTSGGGVTVETRVLADRDAVVVDVSGVAPDSQQTVEMRLWEPRTPSVTTSGDIAVMSQTWFDNTAKASAGFLNALTANGRNVTASAPDSRTIKVTFQPNNDGTFRVVLAAPFYGGGDAATAARTAVGTTVTDSNTALRTAHHDFWHDIWSRGGNFKMSSANGEAEYLENLRQLALYTAAAGDRGRYPMSHGGVANLFSFNRDRTDWDSRFWWHWNLRQQVDFNRSAGVLELNDSYFRLYRESLDQMVADTNRNTGGKRGACVQETMSYGGGGGCNPSQTTDLGYQTHLYSTGAEVGLNIWRQYRHTGDLSFLAENYPVIKQSALFLLDMSTVGSDGKRHMEVSYGHETYWDTRDPATDLAAMKAFFPIAAQAADLLGLDSGLAAEFRTAAAQVPDFALKTVSGKTVIAPSATPVESKNLENVELEPVWPYEVISDDDGVWTERARDTFTHRPYPQYLDWSSDAIHAARLGLANEVRTITLVNTGKFQVYPSGYSYLSRDYTPGSETTIDQLKSPYYEWNGYLGVALHEALVQYHDGLLRIAPAWPSAWDVDGQLSVPGGHRVGVQMRAGAPVTVGIRAGSTGDIQIRNPWSGQQVRVVTSSGTVVTPSTSAATLTASVRSGTTYYVERTSTPTNSLSFQKVSGAPATTAKRYQTRTIGLEPGAGATTQIALPIAAAYNDDSVATANAISDGDFSGGYKLAAETFPEPGTSTKAGVLWEFGPKATGQKNNIRATGQVVTVPLARYSKIHLLAASAFGPVNAPFTVTYSDGTTTTTSLSVPDWVQGGTDKAAVTMPYRYTPTAAQNYTTRLYDLSFSPTSTKFVRSITMPAAGAAPVHVFAMTGEAASVAQPISALYDNDGIATAAAPTAGNFSGGLSYPADQLPAAGAVTVDDVSVDFPSSAGTDKNNLNANSQTINLAPAKYRRLQLLASSSFGPVTGSFVLTYTDGSTTSAGVTVPDWWHPEGSRTAFSTTKIYSSSGAQNTAVHLYPINLPVDSAKVLASVTLPAAPSGNGRIRIFAITGVA